MSKRHKGLAGLAAAKSDPSGSAATLKDVAGHMLEVSPTDAVLAQRRFIEAVAGNPHLVFQLFDDEAIRSAAQRWFADFARRNPVKAGGGGQLPHAEDGHMSSAAPNPISPPGQMIAAIPATLGLPARTEPQAAPVGHVHAAGQASSLVPAASSPSSRVENGQITSAATANNGVPISARPQSTDDIRAAGRIAQHIARTVFDSFRVRDGRPIGDVRWGELENLRSANAQEASIIRQIQRHIKVSDPSTLVRDAVKVAEMERFIQRGAEVADAA